MLTKTQKIELSDFHTERQEVLGGWPTGREVDLEQAIDYQKALPDAKRFSLAMKIAEQQGTLLLQPRAGVALVPEHIALLKFLEKHCDLLPTQHSGWLSRSCAQE